MKYLVCFLLATGVFYSAISVVLAQHQARKVFVEIQEFEKQKDQLNEEWGKLQLEQSTWATDDRIEKIARTELEMLEPDAKTLVLIVQ